MPSDRLVIAIDGPSGSGKSSTSREVARRLGVGYLDTGAMYRAVAVSMLASGVDPADTDAVIEVTRAADIDVSLDPDDRWVRVNGRDVTAEIREPRTSASVSVVARIPECRADLVRRQRALMDADPRGVVAEGRDITTVVYPDASLRVLLTASPRPGCGVAGSNWARRSTPNSCATRCCGVTPTIPNWSSSRPPPTASGCSTPPI